MAFGTPDGVRLQGAIRHACLTANGRVRAGIQFIDPDPSGAELLELVIRLT